MDDRCCRRRACRVGRRSTPTHAQFTTKDTKDTKAKPFWVPTFVSLVSFVVTATPLQAQVYEAIGIRAQGMAGAFVASADDATATWWNPAGLAGGLFFNATLELDTVNDDRHGGFSAAFPALGLSYYRSRLSQIQPLPPTGPGGAVRQDQGPASGRLTMLALQQVGATVGQSVGDHLVIGATIKLMRGDLEGTAGTRGDVDVGVVAAFGGVRIGVATKNVTRPSFEAGADRVEVPRQARAGIAVSSPPSAAVPATVEVDADLTRTPTPFGEARHLAAGGEAWLLRRRLGVRAGVSANTVGLARPSGSAGVSLALRPGFYIEAQGTRGDDQALSGWGISLKVTF